MTLRGKWLIFLAKYVPPKTLNFFSKKKSGLVENVNNCSQKNVTMSIKSKIFYVFLPMQLYTLDVFH
ncbi:hypothetical protein BpHYR1_045241 [Brachionus plicatilis]|uniref:Uncharacterized protein n=1 Tax=Brachionus plicatilis TaxID=10195 RepID=A0A3M7SGV1_BRAPC|nr:hypothetical protein BpHYR1_045241 [Brachionus plicatilis]